jgi:hypothetical protein
MAYIVALQGNPHIVVLAIYWCIVRYCNNCHIVPTSAPTIRAVIHVGIPKELKQYS